MDHLAPDDRARLESLAEPLLVGRGDLVIRKGERHADFYRIESGSLEVVDTASTPEVVVDVLGPGTVVGEMAFLTNAPRTVDVRAGAAEVQLLWWKDETLRTELSQDLELSAAFYRATSMLLSHRLGALTRAAMGGGLGGTQVGTDVQGARDLADHMKTALIQAEVRVRRADSPRAARKELEPVADQLLKRGERLFASLSGDEAVHAGTILANELRPYLVRSKLADLSINAHTTGGPEALAHVELGEPESSDPLGLALDAVLLRLPTSTAIRDRVRPTLFAIEDALPQDRSARVLLLPVGAGTTAARLVPLMAERGGELTVTDSDRDALAFLNSGGSVAAPKVQIRPVLEDLGQMAVYGTKTFFGPQDAVVVDGLAEYLPLRVLAALLRTLSRSLASRGTLILNLLTPSRDSFVFDHLLGWRTVRRDPAQVVDLLHGLGFARPKIAFHDGAAAVITARQPVRR
jgi:CRP-like cAMP-binding protein